MEELGDGESIHLVAFCGLPERKRSCTATSGGMWSITGLRLKLRGIIENVVLAEVT